MAGAKQKGLSVQEASQRLTSVALGLPGHTGICRAIEAVIRPRIHVQLDRYSGAAQSIRIGQIFFEEEIETADRNVGWRQARHIRRARGRRIRQDTGRTRLLAEQRTPAKIVVLLRADEFADVRMQVLVEVSRFNAGGEQCIALQIERLAAVGLGNAHVADQHGLAPQTSEYVKAGDIPTPPLKM